MNSESQTDPNITAGRSVIESNDAQLIAGLRQDDQASLAAIYDQYGSMAYGLALRVLGSNSDTDDVVQESFLALWRQAERLQPERGIKSYLMTIIHNKAIDKLRQRGRRAETALDVIADVPSDDDPVLEAERASDKAVVLQALKGLPEEQRRTIELAYYGGLTLSEVSERMRVPLGTVKSRMRLALVHLRRELVPK